ncbi:MAG: hypothetical protein PF441_05850 [Desulfuromusa sp.]|jgi:hypothetical protein|nr:hypothetical protein [Desulfuromusa sp.]
MYGLKSNPRKCAECGTSKIATILWGMDAKLRAKLDSGRVVLGGYCLRENWERIEKLKRDLQLNAVSP